VPADPPHWPPSLIRPDFYGRWELLHKDAAIDKIPALKDDGGL
jgi:hypothetical protein